MQTIAPVTQKGQVTLPKALRDAFAIASYDSVIIERHDDHIAIRPAKTVVDFIGKIKPRKHARVAPLKARAAMEKEYQEF